MNESPPAIHAPAHAVDHERVLRVVLELEQHRWSQRGGALAFMPRSWAEDSKLDYRYASDPAHAYPVARRRLDRFARIAAKAGVRWTPTLAIDSWRWGIDKALVNAARGKPSDYAVRGTNLFLDPTFK